MNEEDIVWEIGTIDFRGRTFAHFVRAIYGKHTTTHRMTDEEVVRSRLPADTLLRAAKGRCIEQLREEVGDV